MNDVLHAQDFLYTVVERSASGRQPRIVGSICNYVFAPELPEEAIARLASPECRIVSMTVTEAGYLIDHGSGSFEASHPDVRFDLEHPLTPRTFVGLLCIALDRRRQAGLPPFTVLSCDNLQGNGDAASTAVRSFAELRDPALRRWIEQNVAFPNSMVDRITPATTEVERKSIEERFCVRDGWPVFTEPYRQWVIEDQFCNGRPAWEHVGVLMTGNVEPFEAMKMRLLNGSHFAMAYMGAMQGFTYIHEILQDARMRRFITLYMEAVSPAVPAVPGSIWSSTRQPSWNGSRTPPSMIRWRGYLPRAVPSFRSLSYQHRKVARSGRRYPMLSLVVASWLHYFRRRDEQGKLIAIVDVCFADHACRRRPRCGSADSVRDRLYVR